MGKNKIDSHTTTRVRVSAYFSNKQPKKTMNKPTTDSVFSAPAKPQNVETSLQKVMKESVEPPKKSYKKFWITAAILAGVTVLALLCKPAQKEYEHRFVVTPADESEVTPEDQEYLDSLNDNQNEMRNKIGEYSIDESQIDSSVDFTKSQDPIKAGINGVLNYLGDLFGISSKKEDNKKPKKTQTEYVKPQLTANESEKVADNAKNMEPYLKYETMTTKEITDASYARLEFPKYEPLSDLRKNDNKKSKTEQKEVAENPVVVKNKDVVKSEENVQKTVVPETKTNVRLKPEIKESSEFFKKYVTDFIKRDLISKPATYKEAIEEFTKEYGYKQSNDEIAGYVIAKKGDCVSRVMEKEAVKQLGRNLSKREKAIIASMANKVTIGRRTSIDNPEDNNRIMPGDTIPTREIKLLFN